MRCLNTRISLDLININVSAVIAHALILKRRRRHTNGKRNVRRGRNECSQRALVGNGRARTATRRHLRRTRVTKMPSSFQRRLASIQRARDATLRM